MPNSPLSVFQEWSKVSLPPKTGCTAWRIGPRSSLFHLPTRGTHNHCCIVEVNIWSRQRQRFPEKKLQRLIMLSCPTMAIRGRSFKKYKLSTSETYKACCRGEEHPAVFDGRAGTISNHILYVVIETVSTCFQSDKIKEEKT